VLSRRFKFHTHPKSHIQAGGCHCGLPIPLPANEPHARGVGVRASLRHRDQVLPSVRSRPILTRGAPTCFEPFDREPCCMQRVHSHLTSKVSSPAWPSSGAPDLFLTFCRSVGRRSAGFKPSAHVSTLLPERQPLLHGRRRRVTTKHRPQDHVRAKRGF
jgi:hypothetical protein